MFGIRQKLSLGFFALLAIIVIVGTHSIQQLSHLGEAIDLILRENYRSVVACENMKEALERIDSGILFVLLGDEEEGSRLIAESSSAFEEAMAVEMNNITVPGEREQADLLRDLYSRYREKLSEVTNSMAPAEQARTAYFSELLPLFVRIKNTANEILHLNQLTMQAANNAARLQAAAAKKRMYVLLLSGTVLALCFIYCIGRWILLPVNQLIRSAEEIKQGNLDLVVVSSSRDEIGQLSERFNDMAARLRELRRSDRAKLTRIQRGTQQAFKSLPDAVALINSEGLVEIATDSAIQAFNLKPGSEIRSLQPSWLPALYNRARSADHPVTLPESEKVVQHFLQGEERYFQPEAIPILDQEIQLTGVIIVCKDVTQVRHQDDLKRGLVSTVSHQLRTPLTSIRMAIHLLLEEKVGSLNETQAELLLTAREDSDRLESILTNLLDISRIESGKSLMQFRRESPHSLVLEATEAFHRMAEDQGVSFHITLPDDLPDLWVDAPRIAYVFSNLLSNALQHTSPGGQVRLAAGYDDEGVTFSVSDTGRGIPEQYLSRIFDPFFRVPEPAKEAGSGLGLAIVKEIVEAHGGSVTAVSREGEGSTFRFVLKRADHAAAKTEHHV